MLPSLRMNDIGFEISCSWEVLNNKRLNDTVTISTHLKTDKENLDNIVSVDSSIHLTKKCATSCELKLKLSMAKGLLIKKIALVSEARIIEIYGKYEEYMTTCHAEFLDEYEDVLVYITDVLLPEPTSECSLKFACLKKNEMWLYGIHLTIGKAELHETAPTSVNFHNVNKILKDSGHQLTEKAEKCKKFLQIYGSFFDTSKAQLKGPDPQVLLKMFEAEYFSQHNQISSKAKNVSKCLTEILPSFTIPLKQKSLHSEEAIGSNKETDPSVKTEYILECLKHHIDRRFDEFEQKITLKVEEKLNYFERKQNDRIDAILSSLEDLKSLCKNK